MNFLDLIINNIFNIPLICFLCGIVISFFKVNLNLPSWIKKTLTLSILFLIGLKGGGPLIEHSNTTSLLFFAILTALTVWGLLQPFLSFYLLKLFTKIDLATASAIAASFGSISVITFVTAVSFLDQLQVEYEGFMIATLAILEIPAIITGVYLGRVFGSETATASTNHLKILKECVFNKAVSAIAFGLVMGAFLHYKALDGVTGVILVSFKPLLCLFLLDMGLYVGQSKKDFAAFSWSLTLFGFYMPLIGAAFGLLLGSLFALDKGTTTLIAVLTASASYIAVPAAMKVALPKAKEAIYLPLALGVTFPFNVVFGIPIYYYFA